MLSLRTFIFTAAAAFATLSSAMPVAQVNQGTQVVGINDSLNNIAKDVTVKDVHVTVVDLGDHHASPPVLRRDGVSQVSQVVGVTDTLNNDVDDVLAAVLVNRNGVTQVSQVVGISDTLEQDVDNVLVGVLVDRASQPTDVLTNIVGKAAEGVTGGSVQLSGADPIPTPEQNVNGGSTGTNLDGTNPSSVVGALSGLKTRDTPVSLPVALKSASGQLQTLLDTIHNESNGKNTLDVQILVNIVGDVQAIVGELLDHVQLLVGESLTVILSIEGQVLPLIDVATLLQTVLTLVAAILTCVMNLVTSADANVILPLVASLGPFLCQALQCIFGLVPGLLNTVVGLLGGVVAALISLKLDAVVALLKVN